jgi:hypothetical protein
MSSDADATSWLSGEKATAKTEREWPSSVLCDGFQVSSLCRASLMHGYL